MIKIKPKILFVLTICLLIISKNKCFCQDNTTISSSSIVNNYIDSLVSSRVDTIFFYTEGSGMGIGDHIEFVYWKKNKNQRIKFFNVGDSLTESLPVKSIDLSSEINFYIENDIDTITNLIKVKNYVSDDFWCSLTLALPEKTYSLAVRHFELEGNSVDPRCTFINMLFSKLQKYKEWTNPFK